MIVSRISGLLFFAFMNICESEIVAANRGPENPKKGARRPGSAPPGMPAGPSTLAAPTKFGGARRPGSAPVKRRPKVKFKLTIQSENLRLNSRCFYHLEACLKW